MSTIPDPLQAVAEEKGVYERSSNRNIYLNVAINTVKKLRDENLQQSVTINGQKQTSPGKTSKALSHQALLGGSRAAATSFTVRRSGGPCKTPENIKGNDFLDSNNCNLCRYICGFLSC